MLTEASPPEKKKSKNLLKKQEDESSSEEKNESTIYDDSKYSSTSVVMTMQRGGSPDCTSSKDQEISNSDERTLRDREKEHQETPTEKAASFYSEGDYVIEVYEVSRYPGKLINSKNEDVQISIITR